MRRKDNVDSAGWKTITVGEAGFHRISLSGKCKRAPPGGGWLRVVYTVNRDNYKLLFVKYQLVNDNEASSYGSFIDVDLLAGGQLAVHQQHSTSLTIMLTIECIERKAGGEDTS